MAKFLNAKRYGMTNAVHFSVDEAFNTRLAAAAFTHTGLAALADEFSDALADEDKYLQLSRASHNLLDGRGRRSLWMVSILKCKVTMYFSPAQSPFIVIF